MDLGKSGKSEILLIPAKMGLFGQSRGLQPSTTKPQQNGRQVQQAKEKNIISRGKRRKLGGGLVLNKSPFKAKPEFRAMTFPFLIA